MKATRVILGVVGLAAAYVLIFGVPSFLIPAEAYVECTGGGLGMQCTLTHRAGAKQIHVCWDVTLGCVSGPSVTGHACGDVEPQAKSAVVMPSAAFPGLDRCEVSTTKVEHLVLTES
jgi:hypothetical protein